ncbi:MarR family winged helix-turn-helix transcriptional regulator [Catellatospora bangladeshensis]|uniref:MarR family transcriptional regulator n=1 Tax=Catellatospora bangladeshensis TaxID=310355 RepID=A0A8J3JGZ4_9ACTN|nr:MarR family winged helix-turn-helix transcriptional regulator [Catellatospora bangladeshensis]GIF84411.1 MarR family transcriptional regulator [Catellatospora bangladeshensis]
MTTRTPVGPCNNLALRKAARYLGATYDRALAPIGLRSTQFSILQLLSVQGELTISGLAELIAMDRTTMATNLKPLAREGLVTIEPSATDRRARLVALTPAGLAKVKAGLPLWQQAQERFEAKFGAAEAAELRASLDAVLDTGLQPWAEQPWTASLHEPSEAVQA